jgi:hypothetical protein
MPRFNARLLGLCVILLAAALALCGAQFAWSCAQQCQCGHCSNYGCTCTEKACSCATGCDCPPYRSEPCGERPCNPTPNTKTCASGGCGAGQYCSCGTICKNASCPAGGTIECECNGGSTCPHQPDKCHTSCKHDSGTPPYLPCFGALHCYAAGTGTGCDGTDCTSAVCGDYCPKGSTYPCGGKGCPGGGCGKARCDVAAACNNSCKHQSPNPCTDDPDRSRSCCKCVACCDLDDCWPAACTGCCDNTCVRSGYYCGTPQAECTCNHEGMFRCCKGVGENGSFTDVYCFRCRFCEDCDSCAEARASDCSRLGDKRACFCTPSCSC